MKAVKAGEQLGSAREWRQETWAIEHVAEAITKVEREGWNFWDVKPLVDGEWCLLLWWRFPE